MQVTDHVIALLDRFLKAILQDPRVSPAHISLYLSILQQYQLQGTMPVQVYRDSMAAQAKISDTTYHRCINQLHQYGYIRYIPSYDPKKNSTVDICESV